MAVWTREINTNFNFPNIDILNILKDGVLNGYEAIPHEGYVMYDTNDNNVEQAIDPETGEPMFDDEGNPIEVPVTYYFTLAGFPKTYNFANFSWVAVLRSTVDENYIFGGGDDNNHEVM